MPSLSDAMVRSRTACGMSPLIAAAENPRARSFSATSSVACLVRTNTIIASNCSTSSSRVSASIFAVPGHLDVALRDVVGGRGLGLDRHLDRVVQVLGGDLADGRRHGRREQRDLLVLGGVGQDALDILGEAHLQHLVGLVEHQVVQVREVQAALLQVVDHPARGADDDLRAALESGQLRPVGRAAVDRQHVDAADGRRSG